MNSMEIYRGTFFKLTYCFEETDTQVFILAEYNEDTDFMFQIICVTGYKSGTIQGYIKNNNNSKVCITVDELKEGIKRNFLNPEFESLEIFENLTGIINQA
jgi:hypothetical protein